MTARSLQYLSLRDLCANSKNKFGYVYLLTPTGLAEKADLMQRFLQHKIEEYETLKSEIEVLKIEAGPPIEGKKRETH